MKPFIFEYATPRSLQVLNLLRMLLVIICLGFLAFSEHTGFQLMIVLVLVPAILIYLSGILIRKEGTAYFTGDAVQFTLSDLSPITIQYADIATYKIEIDNGCMLRLQLHSGDKFEIHGSKFHGNTSVMRTVLQRFERDLAVYQNESRKFVVREKSIYEKGWTLVMILILSVACLAVTAYLIQQKVVPNATFLLPVILTTGFWKRYLSTKQRQKEYLDTFA